jgi:two-component system nitrogen regulation response regulator GlnG
MHDVIVVDDSAAVRALLMTVLSLEGRDVVAYASPLQALPEIECAGTRVLVTDINMPDMHGADFAHRVREKFPGLPIIALTASIELGRLDPHDFTAVLSKPCAMPELIRLVSACIRHGSGSAPAQPSSGESPACRQ